MFSGVWLTVCVLALGGAVALAWRLAAPQWLATMKRRAATPKPRRKTTHAAPAPGAAVAPVAKPAAVDIRSLQDSSDGWLKVVSPSQVLEVIQAQRPLSHMLRQSRLAPPVWERDLLAAIERYADVVQLMPASESHHHAHAGGLLAHTLEVVLTAMTWRNGTLLPQGAGAEQIDAEHDHWTYVVFYAALLHDIGKILCDLRVQWRRKAGAADETRWMPIAGSLTDCGARSYHVGFTPKSERDYGAHQRMSILLLQRIAPDTARGFMAQHPHALLQLTRFLSGEDRDSALAQLIRKADQVSAARALASGSRARFASASSVPLVELLMGALRDMLRRGSILPLNRDGAAGWVYDGSIWFVAKRLADSVRDHLKQHAPDEALPGESKNDRLFDTWQEYGCILANPATQQAVWYVRVNGKDGEGYSHVLTMLRFPLDKVWDSADQFPASMSGHIEVLAARGAAEAKPVAGVAEPVGQPPEAAISAPAIDTDLGADGAAEKSATEAVLEPLEMGRTAPGSGAREKATTKVAEVRAPAFRNVPKKPAPTVPPVSAKPAPAVHMEQLVPSEAVVGTKREVFVEDVMPDSADDQHAPSRHSLEQTVVSKADKSPGPVPVATSAVVLDAGQLPAVPGSDAGKKLPTQLAIDFMKWLQHGLQTRAIKHNEVGAPVHFVAQGMALVSPLIFREYSRQNPPENPDDAPPADRVGLDVQREVLKAGWHLPAAAGVNIHQFAVVKRGGIRTGRLSAVVLANPQRWVLPVPPNNPALATVDEVARAESSSSASA